MIYRLLLYSGLTLSRTPFINPYWQARKQSIDIIHTAVPHVNRLISSEALGIFYSVNKFRFPAVLSECFWSKPNQHSWPVALISASSQAFLQRVFVAYEIVYDGSSEDQISNLVKLTKRMAASNLRLETFTVKFWEPHDKANHLNDPRTKVLAILGEANRLGFSDARKKMAGEKGTLSIVMGPSPCPVRTSQLIERPIHKSGTR